MSERTVLTQTEAPEVDMVTWTRMMDALGHKDDASRARALKMHHGVISRLRAGKSKPGPKFINQTLQLGIPYAACFFSGSKAR